MCREGEACFRSEEHEKPVNSLLFGTAGLFVEFACEDWTCREGWLSHYRAFEVPPRSPNLRIRVQPLQGSQAASCPYVRPTYRSSGAWAVYLEQETYTFVSPATGDGDRLLSWTPARGVADLRIARNDAEPDVAGILALPFFGAFLASEHALLLHASAVSFDGNALLFAGPSGSGKSFWLRECVRLGAVVLGEDRVVVRQVNGEPWVFGTPWHWSGQLCASKGFPLRRVYFLRQAENDLIHSVAPFLAAAFLLRSSVLPVYNSGLVSNALEVAGQVVARADCYHVGFLERSESVRSLLLD